MRLLPVQSATGTGYRPTPWWRRVISMAGLSVISLAVGVAIAVGAGIAIAGLAVILQEAIGG